MTKKTYAINTLGLAIFLFFALQSTAKSEYPSFLSLPDKALVNTPKIRVTGKTGGSRDVFIEIENSAGHSRRTLKQNDGSFNIEIGLEPGVNTISLTGEGFLYDSVEIYYARGDVPQPAGYVPYFQHAGNNLLSSCLICHPKDKNSSIQYRYVVQTMSCSIFSCHQGRDKGRFPHKPYLEGICTGCHNPHGSEREYFLKATGSRLCFSCHVDAELMADEARHIHFPVSRGECTSCHDPHTSDLEFHLKRGSIVGLCAGCHGTAFSEHTVLHEPVEKGDCIACHTPHISENERLLSHNGNDLCLKCHRVRKEEFELDHVHEPVRKGCTICHDPHGSETIYHLRNKKDEDGNYIAVEQPFRELCLSCHRTLDPEIVDQIEKGTTRHEPVDQGKCTLCHTPHSTNYKKQLRKPLSEICYSCHKNKKRQITRSSFRHGPIRSDDCAQCHLPHGSVNRKLLRSNFAKEFNIEFKIDNYALCFNCHNAEMVSKGDTRETTGFRNGKTNLHYLHVNTNGRSCKACHNIHASNQELHIREKIPFNKGEIVALTYKRTPTGGGCALGCHKPRKYDRITPIINQ